MCSIGVHNAKKRAASRRADGYLTAMLNPHHVELFYHVARHGGIARAVRRMPYGIQQPALSGQILQLERELGLKLFERSPFRLTPEGEALYAFAEPFFENLDAIESQLRRGLPPQLRLGAAEPVLRDHLPAALRQLRMAHPQLQLSLRSGYQAQLEDWLLEREIDLAITALDRRPPPTLRHLALVRLPLALVIPRRWRWRNAATLWTAPRLEAPLISPPPSETISRNFQRGLDRHNAVWSPTIVASSLETLAHYVANGYGIGISVADGTRRAGVRLLPLKDFPPVEIAVLWAGRPSPLVDSAIAAIRDYVRRVWPAQACAPFNATPAGR
jgi:DNA-binding transcriptional LysR family regulator